jgi:hypothetical protein
LSLSRPEPSSSYLEVVTADQSHGNAADEDLVAVLYERNR